MRFLKPLSCALLLLLPLGAAASSVSSMTPETVVQGPDGSRYVESGVNCRGTNEPRTIWRRESDSEWCPRNVEGYCSRQKIRVAQRVCGRQHAAQLEEARAEDAAPAEAQVMEQAQPVVEPAPAVTELAPPGAEDGQAATVARQAGSDLDDEQRQLEIERERLKIEQERLELRRQQVELQKQELELQRQLESGRQAPAADGAPAVPVIREPVRSEGAAGGTPHRSVLGM